MRQAAPEDTRSGASPTWEERDRGSLIKLGFSWSAMSPLSRFRAHEFTALDDRYALVCRLLEESDGFVAAAAVLLCSLTFFLLDFSVPTFVLIAFWPSASGRWVRTDSVPKVEWSLLPSTVIKVGFFWSGDEKESSFLRESSSRTQSLLPFAHINHWIQYEAPLFSVLNQKDHFFDAKTVLILSDIFRLQRKATLFTRFSH